MVVETQAAQKCPACGTPLSQEPWSEGLCPSCVFSLALEDSAVAADLLVEAGEAPTLQFKPDQTFSEGEIQGDRYRIRSLLGRGGMGEVWRAYDLKLRQDVALKALRTELIADKHALETLRQEVRTAREVISPNVCRVFDLQQVDGQELVAMEYVDGTTLQEILKERGPLELNEAREIATQFLAGLEAIHEAGLVHRDIKPENVMVTRTGRVVVMDFGIAKGLGEGRGGMVAGTPAYMSPEQSQGGEVDARADLFSAGVVLAEMVEPGGLAFFDDRRRVWEGIHQAEPQISDTPWSKVIAKAVSAETPERFESASALARALEEVTLRAAGDETAQPYPGLAAFQQEDARFFFGRELEVEALWKKLRRPHLLAVIGPSGAGKSSFLRAGLLPTLTDGWQAILLTPGNRPFGQLAQALATELGEAPGVSELLPRFEETDIAVELLAQWGGRQPHGLLIVDQFEELFTQNPDDVQQSFAELLGRLPLEADLHVLLSMRDDFLFHCHRFESFQPILTDLTLLGPPTGASLRRALVEPALRCGYRFEDETIIEEMLAEVEGERGALPMVAFTAAQLWDRRDRESGLLTRKSYEQIGGVSGALAQHAEAMIDYIGEPNVEIVRELFRNLVTAQGTRASRDRDELLSVFPETEGEPFLEPSKVGPTPVPKPQRPAAKHVLDSLIDARLLTSYETPSDREGGDSRHRIEIVHESLLANWPRLVRWQRQDADSAQMRDELRSQARLWDEHGRSEDYLWTGTAFKEYELWRERYPGGLTDTEEAFAGAMTSLAARRRRRRRIAVTVVVVLAMIVAAVTGGLWLRAEAEARRAEASKLLALAQLQLESDPSEALAYATASLGVVDTKESRVLAMKTLAEAPPVLLLRGLGYSGANPYFSPDGRYLAGAGHAEEVLVYAQDGTGPIRLSGHKASTLGPVGAAWFSSQTLVTGHWTSGRVRLWSIPEGEVVREIEIGEMPGLPGWQLGETHLLAEVVEVDPETEHELRHLRAWRLPEGEVEELGTVDWTALGGSSSAFDSGMGSWVYTRGKEVRSWALPIEEEATDRLVGTHDHNAAIAFWYSLHRETPPGHMWSRGRTTNELRLWDLSSTDRYPIRVVAWPGDTGEGVGFRPDSSGRWLAGPTPSDDGHLLWDLESWPGRSPLALRKRADWYMSETEFYPGSRWLVASSENWDQLVFWPIPQRPPMVVDGYSPPVFQPVTFAPDSRWVVTAWPDDSLRLWPVPPDGRDVKSLYRGDLPGSWGSISALDFDSAGRRIVGTGYGLDLFISAADGSALRKLEGFSDDHLVHAAAFSPSGRLVAAGTTFGSDVEKVLRIWDLESGEVRVFDLEQTKIQQESGPESGGLSRLAFADESTLYTATWVGQGILRWDLETGTFEHFRSPKGVWAGTFWMSGDRRQMITHVWRPGERVFGPPLECESLLLHDLETGQAREVETHWQCDKGWLMAIDSTLSIMVVAHPDGTLGVSRLNDPEPHLSVGHEGKVNRVAISPDLQWIASTGQDGTLRLWPMPDLDKQPLHTLPREELIAKLESMTNVRAVRDPASSTGWSIEVGPFPGWAEVPEW